jgi:hypothetical protein
VSLICLPLSKIPRLMHQNLRYMEKHSSLVSKGLAVSVEQVSMFLTNDGIVISFFENSADDIECVPLLYSTTTWAKLS